MTSQPPQQTEWSRTRSPSVSSTSSTDTTPNTVHLDPSNYPSGNKSLSGISLRAFLLGTTLGLSTSLTITLALQQTPYWRLPFFISALSLFHFLEFFLTARYNTSQAFVSSFLLTSNGWAYNAAHGSALLESLLTLWLWPSSSSSSAAEQSSISTPRLIALLSGLGLVALGQIVRSLAMIHAAANFNHHVQSRRKEDHVLVKDGIYAFLRHPSYFGFFWWGLGTQLVLGNWVCFFVYAGVLWRFFASRIQREFLSPTSLLFYLLILIFVVIGEEAFLISFFGQDYVQYRRSSWVGIPGIP